MNLYRSFESQEELDAQYDVEGAVPNMEEYGAFFERESAIARETLKSQLGVPYGPTLDETLDIFHSQSREAPAPILIYIHGGYWKIHTAREYSFVASGFASAGVATVIPTYSLCPKVTFDEIVRQVRSAIAWTWRNAETINGDRDQIYVVGHSAGAHLSAMAMLTDWQGEYGLPVDIVKGVVGISGIYDLRPLPYTFVGPSLQLDMAQVLRNSPHLRELPTAPPPLVITYGGQELPEFRRQSDDYLARWSAQGLDARFFAQPDRDHFSAITDLSTLDTHLTKAVLNFMSVGGQ